MVFTSSQTIPVLFQLASFGGNKTLAFLHLYEQRLILPSTQHEIGLFFLDYTNTSVLQKLEYFTKRVRFFRAFVGGGGGDFARNKMESAFPHYQVT